MVVSGRPVVFDEGKELPVFARGWDEPLAEGFGFCEGKRFAADGIGKRGQFFNIYISDGLVRTVVCQENLGSSMRERFTM